MALTTDVPAATAGLPPALINPSYWRVSGSIAAAAGGASLSMNFWIPFLPLYLLDLGAGSESKALFWVAIATTVQGIGRLLSGPVWGVLSDRVGRKVMLLRALYFATITTMIMAAVSEPWQVAIAFGCQGVFSGFIPAAVALTSVSVPDERLARSLGLVTSAQYLGNTAGPAIGAGLALAFGYRGAIIFGAALPAIIATAVLFLVPSDRVGSGDARDTGSGARAPLPSFMKSVTFQFCLTIFLYFVIFAMTQLLRLATPIALRDIESGGVAGSTGLTFALGGLSSAFALIFLAGRFFQLGKLRGALAASAVLAGLAHVLLATASTIPFFIFCFALISLLEAAMTPATNTLIASNVPRARRGTAFGAAGSAQALAFMVGPMGAALFAAISLDLGFLVLGGIFLALGALIWLALREPALRQEA